MSNIIMEKLKEKVISFLSQRDNLFFVISAVIAVIAGVFLNCGTFVFTMVLIASVVSGLCLAWFFSSELNASEFVSVGWTCIIFTVFTAICKFCEIDVFGVNIYFGGFVLSLFIMPLLICFIPKISLATKLAQRNYLNHSIWPWAFLPILLWSISCMIGLGVEDSAGKDALFTQEKFVPVKSWTVEVDRGSTVYIVTIPQGKIAVYPSHNPEIRDINSKTQVRVLLSNSGTKYGVGTPCRLEIKN